MQIEIHTKNIELQDSSREYIESKFSRLEHYASALKDESVVCDIHIERFNNKAQGQDIEIRATISVPDDKLQAEVNGNQINEVTDVITEKLERQIEKYKETKR